VRQLSAFSLFAGGADILAESMTPHNVRQDAGDKLDAELKKNRKLTAES